MRRFEFRHGTSKKFWEIEESGGEVTTRWGRIGATGTGKTKAFASPHAAAGEMAKQIAAKLKEGYVETAVETAVATAMAPRVEAPPASTGLAPLWQRLMAWVHRTLPELADDIAPGASAAAIAALEKRMKVAWPAPLRELYRLQNGQTHTDPTGLIWGTPLATLEGLAKIWSERGDFEPIHDSIASVPAKAIRSVPFSDGWIPFLIEESRGNYVAVDLDPGPKGQAGQVIQFGRDYDYAKRYVLAPDLLTFFEQIVNEIEAGNFNIDEARHDLRMARPAAGALRVYWGGPREEPAAPLAYKPEIRFREVPVPDPFVPPPRLRGMSPRGRESVLEFVQEIHAKNQPWGTLHNDTQKGPEAYETGARLLATRGAERAELAEAAFHYNRWASSNDARLCIWTEPLGVALLREVVFAEAALLGILDGCIVDSSSMGMGSFFRAADELFLDALDRSARAAASATVAARLVKFGRTLAGREYTKRWLRRLNQMVRYAKDYQPLPTNEELAKLDGDQAESLAVLLRAFDDPDLRTVAAQGLGRSKHPEAASSVRKKLEAVVARDDADAVAHAFVALRMQADAQAVPIAWRLVEREAGIAADAWSPGMSPAAFDAALAVVVGAPAETFERLSPVFTQTPPASLERRMKIAARLEPNADPRWLPLLVRLMSMPGAALGVPAKGVWRLGGASDELRRMLLAEARRLSPFERSRLLDVIAALADPAFVGPLIDLAIEVDTKRVIPLAAHLKSLGRDPAKAELETRIAAASGELRQFLEGIHAKLLS